VFYALAQAVFDGDDGLFQNPLFLSQLLDLRQVPDPSISSACVGTAAASPESRRRRAD
jgi:hypothetical protein